MLFYYRIRAKIFPENSKRRLFAKAVFNTILKTSVIFKSLNKIKPKKSNTLEPAISKEMITKEFPEISDNSDPKALSDHLEGIGFNEKVKKDIKGSFGVNIVGSIASESGIGEAVRSNIRAIEKAGIPYVLHNVGSNSRENDDTYTNFVEDNPYSINLIHINADGIQGFLNVEGIECFRKRYNIGFWYWELSEFPDEWHDLFKYFDEIWVATDFCLDAITRVSPIPVVKISPSIVMEKTVGFDRAYYGLKKESFIFFFMFDFLSYFERKNPLAVIEAFMSAFRPDEDVLLLIKCSNSDWNIEARDRVMEAAGGLRVKFMDKYFSKVELNALMSLTDCYVSLHRAEGFGLPLAEAMYLKKPVIATGYSGNVDFMNLNNSFLVRYRLVEIEEDLGPYKKGRIWADPDTGHAAELMRLVYDNRDLANRIGEQASVDIKTYLSPEACGRRIFDRIQHIKKYSGA